MLTTEEIELMSYEERVELASKLIASIPAEDNEPIPEWQKQILEERLQQSIEHPEDAIPWEEVLASLKARRKHA